MLNLEHKLEKDIRIIVAPKIGSLVQPSLKNGENLARLHRPDPKNEKVIHKQKNGPPRNNEKITMQTTMRGIDFLF